MTREEVKSYIIGELQMYAKSRGWDEGYLIACDMAMNALEQEPRKGHWIEHNTPNSTYYDCSLCGCVAPCTEFADSYLWKLSNFCPDCGADMRGEK